MNSTLSMFNFRCCLWLITAHIFIKYQIILVELVHTPIWVGLWCHIAAHIAIWFNAITAIWFQNFTINEIWKSSKTKSLCLFHYIIISGEMIYWCWRCCKTLCASNVWVGKTCIQSWFLFLISYKLLLCCNIENSLVVYYLKNCHKIPYTGHQNISVFLNKWRYLDNRCVWALYLLFVIMWRGALFSQLSKYNPFESPAL